MGWLRAIAKEVLVGVISTLVLFGCGALLAVLKVYFPNWFTFAIWTLAGTGLLAVVLVPFMLLLLLRRIPKPKPEVTPENIEISIRKWLDTFRLSAKPEVFPEAFFALVVTPMPNLNVLVMRLKAFERYIVIQSTITVSPEHKAMIDNLSPDDRNVFAARYAAELANMSVGWTLDLPNNVISVERRLPITENLSEDSFMRAIDLVTSAKFGAIHRFVLMLTDAANSAAEKGAKAPRKHR